MAKIKLDLEAGGNIPNADKDKLEMASLEHMAVGLPSPYAAKVAAIRKAKRVQMSFNQMPEPIKKAFDDAALKKGMKQKEYLLYLMRKEGLDIPAYDELDGRRNI